MGELLTFLHRARDESGWTPAERARLEALADSYGGGGGGGDDGLELVFGASDAGDPWCAVKDREDEVVVHVARIGERFVAHFPLDDTIAEGPDLYSTLRDWLRSHEDGVVVAFNPAGREAQSLLALLLAAALLEDELSGVRQLLLAPASVAPQPAASDHPHSAMPEPLAEGSSLGAGATPAELPAEPQLERAAPTALRGDPSPHAASAATISQGADEQPPAAPQQMSPPAPMELAHPAFSQKGVGFQFQEIRGAAGDDLLAGGPGPERLVGGSGDDTLRGGGGGDTLEGGRGDDRIELAGDSVAIGGDGADTFVVQAPATAVSGGDALLGVVVDFRPEEGDQLVTGDGLVIAGPVTGLVTQLQPAAPGADSGRVAVDLDHDGAVDGFVVLRAPDAGAEAWIGL